MKGVKALGLESCMTLGTLTDSQAQRPAEAGLDYYNHNLDTSPEFYGNIITTRTYRSARIRWTKCVMLGSKSAPAASSDWERA